MLKFNHVLFQGLQGLAYRIEKGMISVGKIRGKTWSHDVLHQS